MSFNNISLINLNSQFNPFYSSITIDSSGNVGVGKTEPTTNLDISGNIKLSGVISGSGANLISLNATNITDGVLSVRCGGTGASILTSGSILVGNERSTILQPTNLVWNNTSNKLGIGKNDPGTTLDVNGIITSTGLICSGGAVIIDATNNVNIDSGVLYIDATKNNVGIGTILPDSNTKLHVSGNARIEGNLSVNGTLTQIDTDVTITEQLNITNDGTGPAVIINQTGAQDILDIQDDSSTCFKIRDSGHVEIGTITKPVNVDISGNLKLSGIITGSGAGLIDIPYFNLTNKVTVGNGLSISTGSAVLSPVITTNFIAGTGIAINTAVNPITIGAIYASSDLISIYNSTQFENISSLIQIKSTWKPTTATAADTAIKLATAVNIAGVSFDGSTAISVPYFNLTNKPTAGTGISITAGSAILAPVISSTYASSDIVSIFNSTQFVNNAITSKIDLVSPTQWTTGTSNKIYYNTANIGIGTTDPLSLLDINAISYTGAILTLDAGIINATTQMARSIGKPLMKIGKTSYSTTAGDYYGIGFGYSPTTADYNCTEIGTIITNVTGKQTGDIVFSTRSDTTNVAATERMRILSSGNVGIGKTPGYLLDVNGTINATELRVGGTVLTGWATTGNNYTTASLGIGTATINERLTISGTASRQMMLTCTTATNASYMGFSNSANDSLAYIGVDGSGLTNIVYGALTLGTFKDKPILFTTGASSTEKMRIDSGGNVGIGITNPSNKLHIVHSSTSTNADTGAGAGLYVYNPTNTASNNSIICNRIAGSTANKVIYSMDVSSAYGWSLYLQGNDTTNKLLRFNSTFDASSTSTDRMVINGANGNVGIGTVDPQASLDIVKSIAVATISDLLNMRFDANWGLKLQQNYSAAGNIQYNFIHKYNSVDYNSLTFKGANVGIGTTSPTQILQVGGAGRLRISNSSTDYSIIGTIDADGVNNTKILLSAIDRGGTIAGGNIEYYASAVGQHIFYTTATQTERMRIVNNGNIGIGTTNPQRPLHIQTALRIGGTGAVLDFGDDMTTQIYRNATTREMRFTTNTTDRLVINSIGNVGIGTTNPGYKLDIQGTNPTIRLLDTNTDGNAIIAFKELNDNYGYDIAYIGNLDNKLYFRGYNNSATPTTHLTLDRVSGNIGIGITNPTTAKLVISGTAGAIGLDMSTTDQYAEMRVIRNSQASLDKDMYIQFGAGTDSKLRLYSNNVETMVLFNSCVGIGKANPVTALDVVGTVTATTFSGSGASLTGLPAANITGTLSISNGGTGVATLVANQLLVGNATGALIQSPNLTWDTTNNRLGIGITNPTSKLHLYDDISNNTKLIIQNNSTITPSSGITGQITNSTDRYMIFTAGTSTFTVPTGGIVCDILMIGGGGGGTGGGGGGGGGAGACIVAINQVLNAGSCLITVGEGGLSDSGNNGGDSIISINNNDKYRAKGGSKGSGNDTNGNFFYNLDGGCGGGGSFTWTTTNIGGNAVNTNIITLTNGTTITTGPTIQSTYAVFGNKGGDQLHVSGSSSDASTSSAGGGGIGTAGVNHELNQVTGSAGGNGLYQVTIGGQLYNFKSYFANNTTFGVNDGTGNFYIGGGGGGSANHGNAAGSGGLGGGGAGSRYTPEMGFINTGSGGGATLIPGTGNGGSGIIIIRYRTLISSSLIELIRGSINDSNIDYKIGNYNGDFKIISSLSGTDTDSFTMNSSGLNVIGSIRSTSLLCSGGAVIIDVSNNVNIDSGVLYIDASNNNVGIGTILPDSSTKLHVLGNARIQGDLKVNGSFEQVNTVQSTTEQLKITNDGTGPAVIINQTGSQDILDIQDDTATCFKIRDGGHVNIGTITKVVDVDISGNLKLSGIITGSGSGLINIPYFNLINKPTAGTGISITAGSAISAPAISATYASSDLISIFNSTQFINNTNKIDLVSPTQWINGTLNKIYYNTASIGIGTTNPLSLLDINATSYTGALLTLDAGVVDSTTQMAKSIGKPLIKLGKSSYSTTAGNYYGIGFGYSPTLTDFNCTEIGTIITNVTGREIGDIVFSTRSLTTNIAATERMRILSSGNVGIGITNPSALLDVSGDIIVRAFENNTGGTKGIFFRPGYNSLNNYYNHSILAYDHNADANSDGLSINAYDGVSFCTGANTRQERMRIDFSGNVGIGTINPTSKLHIVHNSTATTADGTGGVGLYVYNSTNAASNNSIISNRIAGSTANKVIYSMDVSGAYGWSMYLQGNDTTNKLLRFHSATDGASGADRMVINGSTGNVGIAILTTATISSKLTINDIVYDRNSFDHSESPMTITHPTATSTTLLNDPKAVLHLCRQGTVNQAFGARASLKLCRWENNSINSRSRLDVTLANGSYDDINIISMRSDGNVGIGKTNPVTALDVVGTVTATLFSGSGASLTSLASTNISGTLTAAQGGTGCTSLSTTFFDTTGGILSLKSGSAISSQWTTLNSNIYFNTGNVGIGITNPNYKLHVNDGILFVGDSLYLNNSSLNIANNYYLLFDNTYNGIMGSGIAANKIRLMNDTSNNILAGFGMENNSVAYHSGSSGSHTFYSGTTNTNYGTGRFQIDQLGNITCTGDFAAFTSISDKRLKTNIIKLDSSIDIIKKLNPVKFNWKYNDFIIDNKQGKEDVGFIAQEIEQIIPLAAGEYKVINSEETYKNIKYERIIPYLVKSMQELLDKVERLEQEIVYLKC